MSVARDPSEAGAGEYGPQLECAIRAARQAGGILRAEFHRSGGPRGTPHHAEADVAAERAIRDVLAGAWPDYGYLGEELGAERVCRDRLAHLWLVDPNDGTSTFVQGFRGAAVSIGLLREGRPVLGVVYAYSAPDDEGDLFAWAEGAGSPRRNGKPVSLRGPCRKPAEQTVLLAQGSERYALSSARLVSPLRYRAAPSIAYRLALVAAGEADAAVSTNAPASWDYAAGHALLRGAGGDLYDSSGAPVRYDRDGSSRCGGRCFGGSATLAHELAKRDWGGAERCAARGPEAEELCWPVPGHAVSDPGLLGRAQGCLLGQLAGDALGSLVEFASAAELVRGYPGGLRRMADGGTWDTIAGQPTDDSELALALARALVRENGYSEEAVAQAYAAWYLSGPFDIGGTTQAALRPAAEAVQAGRSALEAARQAASAVSQANGALMRISPLGILCATCGEEAAVRWARADARLTHPHPVCQDASLVFVGAVGGAVASGDGPEQVYSNALRLAESAKVCPEILAALRRARLGLPQDYCVNQGWVLTAFQNAFYQLLHSGGLETGVVDTVMRGGDTDTNAAVAGALLGAVYGREAVPAEWLDRLLSCRPVAGLEGVRRPRPAVYWPVDVLRLAERLLLAGREAAAGRR